MTFDSCSHQITQIVLKAGAIIRQLKGLPRENNITLLYNETAPLLGIIITSMNSRMADRLPAPHEMKKEDGAPLIPLRRCPQCGKDAMQMFGLCPTCEDAKGENGEIGKYKVKFECKECQFQEKSDKPMVLWLREMGVDFGMMSKKNLGIKTITDDGEK